MFSRCPRFCHRLRLVLLLSLLSATAAIAAKPLRICADPDNLPFSNRAEQGFDNRIAILIAHSWGASPNLCGPAAGAASCASSSIKAHAMC
jgi:hypothetical protein